MPADKTQRTENNLTVTITPLKVFQQAGIRKIKVIPILIGVSGTLYQNTLDSLECLGLSQAESPKTTAKLHIQAIKSVYSIVLTTRVLVQNFWNTAIAG